MGSDEMTEFLDSITEIIREQVNRHRNWPFLNAAMAACAIVATAGGGVSFCHRMRIDHVLETLDRLRVFDPHEGVELFNSFVEKICRNSEVGRRKALNAMASVSAEKPLAEMLLRVCMAVSGSEGEISDLEKSEIANLCEVLEIEPDVVGLDYCVREACLSGE